MDDSHREQSDNAHIAAGFSRWPLVYAAVLVCGALTLVSLYLFSNYFAG